MIKNFLDLDYYKLTMGQLVFNYFPDIPVTYNLTNRSKEINLSDYISELELKKQLELIKGLKIRESEDSYLKKLGIFSEDYLQFLRKINLPDVDIFKKDGRLHIKISGPWSTAIYWETFVLTVLTELYCSSYMKRNKRSEKYFIDLGKQRLLKKIDKLKKYPEIKFADFGTRRRFDFHWQKYVLQTVKEKLPGQLVGTSNVILANDLNLKPVGTFAHELYMVLFTIDQDIIQSHKKVLDLWWNEYGKKLSTALTDNYGSDFFFNNFSKEEARNWQGLRHDSGDPIEFGEKTISFYQKLGIDPKEKTIVFSDSLNVDLIIKIYNHFSGRIKSVFGWGTDLTNDFAIDIPQIVVKPVEANGRKTAKLTDAADKMTGDRQTIDYFRRIGYHSEDI